MYSSPLYGKEWHWRNVKMEAHDVHMIQPDFPEKGICCYAANPFFIE